VELEKVAMEDITARVDSTVSATSRVYAIQELTMATHFQTGSSLLLPISKEP
jgi:hypothetical protein